MYEEYESSTFQETDLHDNADAISWEAESDGKRFYLIESENSFSLEGSMSAYGQKYVYQHLTEDSIKRNIINAATVPTNALWIPPTFVWKI